MRELVARVLVLHKHDLTSEKVLKAALSETHSTNLLHQRVTLASKLLEEGRCGDKSRAKEAASKLEVETSCWVVRASLARLSRALDAEGVREHGDSRDRDVEFGISSSVEDFIDIGCQEGKIEKTDEDIQLEKADVKDNQIAEEKGQVMEGEGDAIRSKDSDNDAKQSDILAEQDGSGKKTKDVLEQEALWQPGRVEWLQLMEGEDESPG